MEKISQIFLLECVCAETCIRNISAYGSSQITEMVVEHPSLHILLSLTKLQLIHLVEGPVFDIQQLPTSKFWLPQASISR